MTQYKIYLSKFLLQNIPDKKLLIFLFPINLTINRFIKIKGTRHTDNDLSH